MLLVKRINTLNFTIHCFMCTPVVVSGDYDTVIIFFKFTSREAVIHDGFVPAVFRVFDHIIDI